MAIDVERFHLFELVRSLCQLQARYLSKFLQNRPPGCGQHIRRQPFNPVTGV